LPDPRRLAIAIENPPNVGRREIKYLTVWTGLAPLMSNSAAGCAGFLGLGGGDCDDSDDSEDDV
jgi:hypothetical protein